MTTITTSYKIGRAVGFWSLDRDPIDDARSALLVWAELANARVHREVGESSPFLLVELTFNESGAAQAADDLAAVCAEKLLTAVLHR